MRTSRLSRPTRSGARIIQAPLPNIRSMIPITWMCSTTPPWKSRSGTIWNARSGWCEPSGRIDRQPQLRQRHGQRQALFVLQGGFSQVAKNGGAIRPVSNLAVGRKDDIEIPQTVGEGIAISFDQSLTEGYFKRRCAVRFCGIAYQRQPGFNACLFLLIAQGAAAP